MKDILLIYGPAKGSTEKVAKQIAEELGSENVELKKAVDTQPKDFENYKKIILGASTIGKETWNADHAEMGWDKLINNLDEINFTNKTVAFFGLGNQITYPNNFVDTMGEIAEKTKKQGAKLIGEWSVESYEFESSKAKISNKDYLVGLAIDEDTQDELTEERISTWTKQLKEEF